MKILHVGVHRDGTGWAEAALRTILALDSVPGVEVVPRALVLDPSDSPIPERVRELESRSARNPDVVIQAVPPALFEYEGRIPLNVLSFFAETEDCLLPSGRFDVLQCLPDLTLTCSDQPAGDLARILREASPNAIPKIPRIENIPIPADPFLHERAAAFSEKLLPPEVRKAKDSGRFLFYTIGEATRRKNLRGLLEAFHAEFAPDEPVSLVIKTSFPGLRDPDKARERLRAWCEEVRSRGMKFPGDHAFSEVLVVERLSATALTALHVACDCFVQPSHAEAWCAVPGVVVDVDRGPTPIEEVRVGDRVVTHLGRYKTVTNVLSRNYEGDVVCIRPHGTDSVFTFTPEHPHYVVKRRGKKYYKDVKLEPTFENAADIVPGDFWVVPKLKPFDDTVDRVRISDLVEVVKNADGVVSCPRSYPNKPQESLSSIAGEFGCSYQFVSDVLAGKAGKRKLAKAIKTYAVEHGIDQPALKTLRDSIELTPEFMFFVGHYLAEGWSEKSKNSLATHKKEQWGRDLSSKAVEDAFGLRCVERHPKESCVNLVFNNAVVARFLKALCGEGASDKFIHPDLKRSENIAHLIRGFFYGDGCFSNGRFSMYTTSPRLARDVVEVCNRLGIFVGAFRDRRKNGLRGWNLRVAGLHDEKFVSIVEPYKYGEKVTAKSYDGQPSFLEDENAFYLPIRSVGKIAYVGPVYNLSIDEDESYTVGGYATHNCIPAFDAMALGKTPIVTDHGGYREYVDSQTGDLIPARIEPVFGNDDGFSDLFTGRESWASVNRFALRRAMRRAYEERGSPARLEKARRGIAKAASEEFSARGVGRKLHETLLSAAEGIGR